MPVATTYSLLVTRGSVLGDPPKVGETCPVVLTLPLGATPPIGLTVMLTPGVGLLANGSAEPAAVTIGPGGYALIQLTATAAGTYTFALSNNAGLADPAATPVSVTFAAAQLPPVSVVVVRGGVLVNGRYTASP